MNGMRTTLPILGKRYEINPHARTLDYTPEQVFPVVKGDDQIRTGESAQRIDPALINPGGAA